MICVYLAAVQTKNRYLTSVHCCKNASSVFVLTYANLFQVRPVFPLSTVISVSAFQNPRSMTQFQHACCEFE